MGLGWPESKTYQGITTFIEIRTPSSLTERGIVLSTLYADCVPLVFYDPWNRAIGMAHAGWRGNQGPHRSDHPSGDGAGFWQQKPSGCLVGIGPSIGPCCYSVGPEVAKEFAPLDVVHSREGKLFVDLSRANQRLLMREGVPPENIQASGNLHLLPSRSVFFPTGVPVETPAAWLQLWCSFDQGFCPSERRIP